jgi:hypothetical protein
MRRWEDEKVRRWAKAGKPGGLEAGKRETFEGGSGKKEGRKVGR